MTKFTKENIVIVAGLIFIVVLITFLWGCSHVHEVNTCGNAKPCIWYRSSQWTKGYQYLGVGEDGTEMCYSDYPCKKLIWWWQK